MGQAEIKSSPAAIIYDTEKTPPQEVEVIKQQWKEVEQRHAEIQAQIAVEKAFNKKYGFDECANLSGLQGMICGFEKGFGLIPKIFLNSAMAL